MKRKRTYEPREFTNYLLNMFTEDGTCNDVVISLLSYMSDDDAYDWAISNGYMDPDEWED